MRTSGLSALITSAHAGDFLTELTVAINVAREAGELAQAAFEERTFDVAHKADDQGPVTTADRAANTLISQTLHSHFPGDTVVAEESVADALWSARTWFVDPIDGTRQFVDGLPEFAVMIGLCVEGEPVVGVIYHPPTQTTSFAVHGCGAFSHSPEGIVALTVSDTSTANTARIVRSRSRPSAAVDGICQRLAITEQRHMGSLGLKLVEVASGRAEIYINLSGKISQWDGAAGHIIVTEAGGRVSVARGGELRYRPGAVLLTDGLVATNGLLHADVLAVIPG